MLVALALPAVGLLAAPARPAFFPSAQTGGRACVLAAAVADEPVVVAPTGFYWGFDSSNPDAELVTPPVSLLDRLGFSSFDSSTKTISEDEVLTAQANWANAITTISAIHAEGGDFVGAAAAAAGELYGYGKTNVLFKPTKATAHPFRPTGEDAMSYFVGAEAMSNDEFKGEDAGFAINGGRGWKSVVFRNHQIELMGDSAIAMGDYVFTDATSGDEVRVEYTFGYRKNDDGKCRIFLHHSSVPYAAAPAPAASEAPVTEEEVAAAQKLWADSIASISKVYLDGGDYVGAAGEAAGKLYGYGHCDVLFKPTKATAHPFRPTGEDAMSYFVGAEAMGNDEFKGEDAGFAINGGRGWKSVVFRNHKVDLNGPTAQAMGDYIFTDATSGDEVRVEYTFGYKRCEDGNVRIYLHHSSVPYAAAPAPAAAAPAAAAPTGEMSVAQACQFMYENEEVSIEDKAAFLKDKGATDFVIAQATCCSTLDRFGVVNPEGVF